MHLSTTPHSIRQLGVDVRKVEEGLLVVAVEPPALLLEGDLLRRVNAAPLFGADVEPVALLARHLRDVDTPVALEVLRDGNVGTVRRERRSSH